MRLGVALGVSLLLGCAPESVRIATFNVRRLGVEDTDLPRLSALVRGTGAPVVALQEVMRREPLDDLVRRLDEGGGRWRYAMSTCGGRRQMHLAFVYDARRVTLESVREYPELAPDGAGDCGGERPGLLGTFARRGRRVQVLTMHLPAGPDRDRVVLRRRQWERAAQIARDLGSRRGRSVVVLGDANSTGWSDDREGERTHLREVTAAAGLRLASERAPCTEYWRGAPDTLTPSVLDHVAASLPGPDEGDLRVQGYCRELACRPVRAADAPADYRRVSDHCPVVFDALMQ